MIVRGLETRLPSKSHTLAILSKPYTPNADFVESLVTAKPATGRLGQAVPCLNPKNRNFIESQRHSSPAALELRV